MTPPVMRAWRTHAYGPPHEALRLDTIDRPEPAGGEVLVQVQAAPLNLNDLERVMGGNMMVEPELPYSPGMEVMGVVTACGEGAEAWLDRRVVAITKGAHGGFAEYAVCPVASTFAMPERIPLPDAAAILFPFHLAWLGLFDRATLQPGEWVLIHAGAGGSGSAAIQLAADAGAHVIATAGGSAKVELCRSLGAAVAVDYTAEDFAPIVLAETEGRGVDVVFDNVGETVLDASMNCTAYNGRYVMMGFASNKAVADEKLIVPRRLSMGNLKLCGVVLAYADPATAGLVKEMMGWNLLPTELGVSITAEVVDRITAGRLRPVVGDVVRFDDLPAALQAMADRRTTGRTIVTV
jgi:NADPH2:quinone reductase